MSIAICFTDGSVAEIRFSDLVFDDVNMGIEEPKIYPESATVHFTGQITSPPFFSLVEASRTVPSNADLLHMIPEITRQDGDELGGGLFSARFFSPEGFL